MGPSICELYIENMKGRRALVRPCAVQALQVPRGYEYTPDTSRKHPTAQCFDAFLTASDLCTGTYGATRLRIVSLSILLRGCHAKTRSYVLLFRCLFAIDVGVPVLKDDWQMHTGGSRDSRGGSRDSQMHTGASRSAPESSHTANRARKMINPSASGLSFLWFAQCSIHSWGEPPSS